MSVREGKKFRQNRIIFIPKSVPFALHAVDIVATVSEREQSTFPIHFKHQVKFID